MMNRKLIKVVSGTLASSTLVASCTQYLPPADYVYGNVVAADSDLGQIVVPISIQIQSEDGRYIKAIQKITDEIIKSPQKAKEFNENPKSVLAKHGYYGNISMDESLIKITMALADIDIYNAIKSKDFKQFVHHCLDKGVLSSQSILSNDFYKNQLDSLYQNDNFKKFHSQLESNGILRSSSDSSTAALSPVLVACLAVAVGVAVVFAAIFWICIEQSVSKINDVSSIDVYILREGMENTYIAVDKYTEGMVNDVVSIIKEEDPNYFKTNSEMATRNLIKVNIVNNL
jgi:preprotein translocase subunit Sec61beta